MLNLPVIMPAQLTPTFGATRAVTTLVHGSVPATSINLSGRALARGTPRARHHTRPSVPSFSYGATSGRPAIIMAICALPRADLQELPEDHDRRHRGLPLLPCNSRVLKREAPEHRDSIALIGSLALTPWP